MMLPKLLMIGLLAMSFAPSGVRAQTASTPERPAAQPVDPGSLQALRDMGAQLQSLKRFRVSSQVTGERVLADGQKLQHTATANLDVRRPDRLRVRMASARSERELSYDGKTVTLYAPARKHYSTVDFSGDLAELVKRLETRYGVELPLADLFLWGTPGAPLDRIESALNAGQDFIGSDLCDHYAFRQGKVDWQIWITAGNRPLPRKIVITNRADEARPQSVHVLRWDLKPTFKDSVFTFTAPRGASAAEVVPLKTR